MRENTSNRNKKLLAVGVAAALGAGTIGVGANWDHITSVVGNQFTATVKDVDPGEVGGALLTIAGAPIVHDFDTTKFNDVVEARWTVTNRGTDPAQYAANFEPTESISQNLAENLDVFYGVTDEAGEVTSWRPAGTMADPVEYTAVMDEGTEIAGNSSMVVPVRIVLEDPTLLEGDEETVHSVVADFTVSYMNRAPVPEPSAGS